MTAEDAYPFTEMEIARDRHDMPSDFVLRCEDYLLDFGFQSARAYANDLTSWWAWCICQSPTVRPLSPAVSDISAHLQGMLSSGYSPNTVARRLTALRGFFATFTEPESNPTRQIPRIRRRRRRIGRSPPNDSNRMHI